MIGERSDKFYSLYERERIKVEKRLVNSLRDRKPGSLYDPGLYIIDGGGKRLRPLLVLLSSKAAGGKFSDAYNASVAVELLHNFTLVHDDIMDNADKRRGRLTLHVKNNLSTAILVGDSLLSIAYEYLLKDCNGETKQIMSSFTKSLIDVCEGQSLDKDFESRKSVKIEEYIEMIEKKTAALLEMCCKVGGILGGGSKKEINALANFGKNIGIAFQIQDDLLDITGEEIELGKFVGGDLVEGKKTFLFIKALEKAEGNDLKSLQKVISNSGIKTDQINFYKHIYLKLNVLEDARSAIKYYSGKALSSLKSLNKEEDREIFTWLANSLIKRNK